MPAKIATCTYCGHRAALVLTGRDGHELACSACGAPLHDLKPMPSHKKGTGHNERPAGFGAAPHGPKMKKAKSRRVHYETAEEGHRYREDYHEARAKYGKKRKKKKSAARRLFGEAFDLIEDIFD